ncbi:MAG: hypothetical protein IBJ11_10700, partial [Phycisphaerales bacterium]|nr:hypothetical protein [Phycisphaerales bacterium]
MRPPAHRPAFTLLEAVIALAILATVAVVTLEIRARTINSAAGLAEKLRDDRDAEALFTMLLHGALPLPVVDERNPSPVWSGTHRGRPYTIRRAAVTLPNPAIAARPAPTGLARAGDAPAPPSLV